MVEEKAIVADAIAPVEVPVTETPVSSPTNNQELLQMIEMQQKRIEMLDAELQIIKMKLKRNVTQ
jgi:hypothetical protein